PAPGRNAFMIGTTVPTVIPTGDTQFNRQQDQTNASLLSLGGGTRRGNNYTLDGVPITDLRNRASANPTIEALDDVKVQVHTYDAEMGRTGGGVFNTTLRSGTNNFHGTAFFQTRPIWGAANNYFSQKALQQCAPNDASCVALNRKQDTSWYTPGAGLGGPVVQKMLSYLLLPLLNLDNGAANFSSQAVINDKFQQLYSVKVEHKFTDKVALTGFYLYNRTDEPCSNYIAGLDDPNRFLDTNDY